MHRFAATLLCFILILAVSAADWRSDVRQTVPGFMLNDWQSFVVGWSKERNFIEQIAQRPAGLNTLRIANDYTKPLLQSDGFMLRINDRIFSDPKRFNTSAKITPQGILETCTLAYDNEPLPISLCRKLVVPPFHTAAVWVWEISGSSGDVVELLDFTTTANHDSNDQKQWGWLDKNGLFVDETKQGGFFLGAGFLNIPVSKWLFGTEDQVISSFCSGQYDSPDHFEADSLTLAQYTKLEFTKSETKTLLSYRIGAEDYQTVLDIRSKISSIDVLKYTSQQYATWLSSGHGISLSGEALLLYQNTLVMLKNGLNPTLGTMVASMHPAYGFKHWSRDTLFGLMILGAAGFSAEAELGLEYFAGAPLSSQGIFHTCYDFWTGENYPFVEPQGDPMGMFLTTATFLATKGVLPSPPVYKRMQYVGDFLTSSVQSHKKKLGISLVFPDYSIWEESSDPITGQPLDTAFFTYTQAHAAHGLKAASKLLANVYSQSSQWAAASEELIQTLHSNLYCGDHFCRSLAQDGITKDSRTDAATANVVFFNLTDITTAKSHLASLSAKNTKDTWGLCRYPGDVFFYTGRFSPAMPYVESTGAGPAWPVVTLYTAIAEYYCQMTSNTQSRVKWTLNRMAFGQTPVGEAVDPKTQDFIHSSAPDLYESGGMYMWAQLILQGIDNGPSCDRWNIIPL